jgi:multiple sugar transport system ATP-binding protein
MAEVSVVGLQKSFGSLKVLKNISLEIDDGEFVVLVGPSGCGKSTLLRTIAGLEETSEGQIWIGGRMVNGLAAKNRDIAMVFQSYALYPHMTVAQNMSFALRLKGTPKPEIEARTRRAADILGLADLLERYPRQLSGGQRQRVAMGRAIVRDPKVFLFDEPLSNLDAKLRVQMRTEIKELHQRLQTTTIYVTHDQVEAMTMANKIVVMRHGIVEQIGSPLELYDRPRNLFVADFIGSPAMNFLDGTATDKGFTTIDGIVLPTPEIHPHTIKYGIRPEDLHFDASGVEVDVVVVEPTGPDTHVVGRLGTQTISAVIRERVEILPGTKIKLMPDGSRAHFFAKDGLNLKYQNEE